MINNLPHLIKKRKIPDSESYQDFLSLIGKGNPEVAVPVNLVEKVLVSKLKTGDYSAFSNIFTAYYSDLILFAFRFTRDMDNAEELVQETFVRLWEEHETLNISVSLKSYLLKTVQNRCLDWLRHKKVMQAHNSFVLESTPQVRYDTDSYVLYSELEKQIEDALLLLPEEISATFKMNRYKGLKYTEIAKIMDVSVRTIEVRVGKALHILRNCLKDYLLFTGIIYISCSYLF